MAYTIDVTLDMPRNQRISRDLGMITGSADLTLYHQTAAEVTEITGLFGTINQVIANGLSDNGYLIRWDPTDEAFHAFYATTSTTSKNASPLNIEDDDSVAGTHVVVYAHIDEAHEQGSFTGHLEFVSPTSTDGSGTIANGGATFLIQDDNSAASGGVQIYFDEDGANADERLMAAIAHDALVMLSDGNMLRIKADASAASVGVALYFDEDAAATYERLAFVSPTSTAGVGATDDVVGMAYGETTASAAGTEVANSTDVGEFSFIAVGLR